MITFTDINTKNGKLCIKPEPNSANLRIKTKIYTSMLPQKTSLAGSLLDLESTSMLSFLFQLFLLIPLSVAFAIGIAFILSPEMMF
ncbi:MAG: hypothetical protein H6618_06370 [Deltaproteobacteria bacterium]|nr:hypothetical protein [Deltaproteobacteria bacterium]